MLKSDRSIPNHISDFLDWLDIEKGLSSKSQENYGRFIKRFIDWLSSSKLSSLKPHELAQDHIWNYRVFLSRSATLKKSTQNYYLIAVRSLLNYFANKDIQSLPSEKIALARDKDERKVRFLTLEQLKALLETPDTKVPTGLRDRAILEAFFSTGLRISELTALNRDQFPLDAGKREEFELSIKGKGGRTRTVYFSKRALEWLDAYLKTRKDDEKALFINYRKRGGASARLTPRSIEASMKRYVALAGLPQTTTPHVMRHTFATDLLSQGVDIRVLQEFLGHKSIMATQIYAHVTSQKLRETHRKFHSTLE